MIPTPNCYKIRCKHLIGAEQTGIEETEVVVCDAFPKGIPNNILSGEFNHIKPHPDQTNSIVFEQKE